MAPKLSSSRIRWVVYPSQEQIARIMRFQRKGVESLEAPVGCSLTKSHLDHYVSSPS